MGTKMKGLLKGLRYISQIFDSEAEEQEMQIGYPTDVKHVAHIGWDGPSVSSSPSWMNEFRSTPLSPSDSGAGAGTHKLLADDLNHSSGMRDSPRGTTDQTIPKPSRRGQTSGPDSPRRNARRNHSADSTTREASDGSRHRRNKGGSSAAAVNGGSDLPGQDLPAIPKQARRKKTKGGSSGGSSRSSRSKAIASEDASGELVPAPAAATTEEERL